MISRFSAPIFGSIDVNTKCNLKCIHCRVDKTKDFELKTETVLDLINQLDKLNVFHLHFAGGEPFLHPGIYKILNYSIKTDIPKVSISTNATCINFEKLKKLKSNKLTIIISFDGCENTHNFIRGKRIYQKVIKTIKQLVKFGFSVKLRVTLMKKNLSEFDKIVYLSKKMKVKQVTFSWVVPVFENILSLKLTKKERETILHKYKKYCKDKEPEIQLDQQYFCYPDKIDNTISYAMGCRAGRSQLSVFPNGDVVGCKLLPFVIAGNIYKNKLKEIWEDKKRWSLFLNIKKNLKTKYCKVCKYFHACRGGCRAQAYYFKKDLYVRDPTCTF